MGQNVANLLYLIPMAAFRTRFGELTDEALSVKLRSLLAEFIADSTPMPDRRREPAKTT